MHGRSRRRRAHSTRGVEDAYVGGVVAYSNDVKRSQLGVPEDTCASTAPSRLETAVSMATGVRQALHADVGVSVSGIAGLGGGTEDKPVGLVYVCVDGPMARRRRSFSSEGPRRHPQRGDSRCSASSPARLGTKRDEAGLARALASRVVSVCASSSPSSCPQTLVSASSSGSRARQRRRHPHCGARQPARHDRLPRRAARG